MIAFHITSANLFVEEKERRSERVTERMESFAHFCIVLIWFAVITLAYGVGEFNVSASEIDMV